MNAARIEDGGWNDRYRLEFRLQAVWAFNLAVHIGNRVNAELQTVICLHARLKSEVVIY